MSDKWEDMGERAEQVGGGGKFVKLKDDKDTIVCAFVGDPEGKELFFDQKQNKYVDYTQEHAKAKKPITLRVKMNVLVVKEGNGEDLKDLDPPVVKILEVNATTFRQIIKAKKKYGFEKCFFEVCRNGAKGDTNTTYSILSDEHMTDEDREALKSLELHDLTEEGGDDEGEGDGFDSYDKSKKSGGKKDDGEDPISSDDVADLIGKLKPLPREDLQKFLSRFGVKQIKALKKKDLGDAKKFVNELAGAGDEGEGEGEEDPFA